MINEVVKKDVSDISKKNQLSMSDVSKKKYAEAVSSTVKRNEILETKKGGGAFKDLENRENTERHHIPSCEASDLPRDDGPCIIMDKQDHMKTASWGRAKEAQIYRAKQKELIENGHFKEAQNMDIKDIRNKFGNKYDTEIKEAQAYTKSIGRI